MNVEDLKSIKNCIIESSFYTQEYKVDLLSKLTSLYEEPNNIKNKIIDVLKSTKNNFPSGFTCDAMYGFNLAHSLMIDYIKGTID